MGRTDNVVGPPHLPGLTALAPSVNTPRMHIVTENDRESPALPTLAELFPWVSALPEEAVGDFLAEYVTTARRCAASQRFAPLDELVAEWQSTAEIYADLALNAWLATCDDNNDA